MKHGGRAKGTPNKTTSATRQILATFIEGEVNYIADHITELTTKERADLLAKLIPYVVPKQHQVEQQHDTIDKLPTWFCDDFSSGTK